MLEISIRKNQELKDRNYQLEKDMQVMKEQSKQDLQNSYRSNGRRAFCEERPDKNHVYADQPI